MRGDVQYLADSILLEKLAIMEIGLSKTAGLMDSLKGELGSLSSGITSEVSSAVGEKGVMATLEEFLATGVIMRFLGPWGIAIEFFASLFGFNIESFIGSILDYVKKEVSSGNSVSLNTINDMGKSVVAFSIGDELIKNSDMFYLIRKADSDGTIMKLAAPGYFELANRKNPVFSGQSGIIGRIFGSLFSSRGNGSKSSILMIIAGIIVWIIKSVLLGAGVVGASKLVNHFVNKSESNPNSSNKESDQNQPTQQTHFNIPPPIPNSFQSSGEGNQYHINDGSSMWIIPLLNNDVAKTLTWWTISIYPELKGHESEFNSSAPFNNMVSILTTQIDPNHPEYAKIPQGLHTRKEIVDRFAGEVKIDSKDAK